MSVCEVTLRQEDSAGLALREEGGMGQGGRTPGCKPVCCVALGTYIPSLGFGVILSRWFIRPSITFRKLL